MLQRIKKSQEEIQFTSSRFHNLSFSLLVCAFDTYSSSSLPCIVIFPHFPLPCIHATSLAGLYQEVKVLSLITRASVTLVSAKVSVTRSLLVSANAPWACSLCDVKGAQLAALPRHFPRTYLLDSRSLLDFLCLGTIELFDADLSLLFNKAITAQHRLLLAPRGRTTAKPSWRLLADN